MHTRTQEHKALVPALFLVPWRNNRIVHPRDDPLRSGSKRCEKKRKPLGGRNNPSPSDLEPPENNPFLRGRFLYIPPLAPPTSCLRSALRPLLPTSTQLLYLLRLSFFRLSFTESRVDLAQGRPPVTQPQQKKDQLLTESFLFSSLLSLSFTLSNRSIIL